MIINLIFGNFGCHLKSGRPFSVKAVIKRGIQAELDSSSPIILPVMHNDAMCQYD